jgi:hypothetical protein
MIPDHSMTSRGNSRHLIPALSMTTIPVTSKTRYDLQAMSFLSCEVSRWNETSYLLERIEHYSKPQLIEKKNNPRVAL